MIYVFNKQWQNLERVFRSDKILLRPQACRSKALFLVLLVHCLVFLCDDTPCELNNFVL